VGFGSVTLLADTTHKIGGAESAMPIWIAFVLARLDASKMFPYRLGRVEDHASLLPMARFIGFVGNEAVAVFRIRAGRHMSSAALIADRYHARTVA